MGCIIPDTQKNRGDLGFKATFDSFNEFKLAKIYFKFQRLISA